MATHSLERTSERAVGPQKAVQTTVDAIFTGHVRTKLGMHQMAFTFEGDTLREFLNAFFEEYDVRELVMAEREADATTRGWVKTDHIPGTWRKNPEGEQTRAYARVMVNGKFNENLDGLDTKLEDGDRVALVFPFTFCV